MQAVRLVMFRKTRFSGNIVIAAVGRRSDGPQFLFGLQTFKSHMIVPRGTGRAHPDHPEPCLPVAVLQSEHVSPRQSRAHCREAGAFVADVDGADVLDKGLALAICAPYPHGQNPGETRLPSSAHYV